MQDFQSCWAACLMPDFIAHRCVQDSNLAWPELGLCESSQNIKWAPTQKVNFTRVITRMINFLKQAEFKVFACSVLSLCQSQVWSCFEIWLPKSSLCTERFALSPANLQSVSLCCNHLHSPLQVQTKKSFLSLLRLIYPLHLLSAGSVPQNPNQFSIKSMHLQ